jgi:hypothetical protein
MKQSSRTCLNLAFTIAVLLLALPAFAGTKYQTSLVPNQDGSMPGFSSSGSSIRIDDHLQVTGKIKRVVDGGDLVSTESDSTTDDYSVEIDLAVAATGSSGTITISFDVKNGNGTFKADISADPVLSGAAIGDGVAVNGVRVKDSSGTVLGTGGFGVR